MTAFVPLGILGLGLAFILGILNGFPVPNIPLYDPVDVNALDETYDASTARQVADRFGAVYEALINDILSFQQNPDFQRAESRRLAMLAFGNQTSTDLDIFARRLQSRFGELSMQPSELMAQDRPSDAGGAIDLAWVPALSLDVIEQRLYRSVIPGGPYALVVTLADTNASSYTDQGLTDGTAYYYIITASDGSQESLASNEASATPVAN